MGISNSVYNEKLKEKTGGSFSLVGQYDNLLVEIKHEECNRMFERNPRYFLSNLKCPLCERDKKKKVLEANSRKRVEKFKEKVKELVGDKYQVIGDMIDSSTGKVEIKHVECGNIYPVRPGAFIDGRRCPECTKTKVKSPEQYRKEFMEVAGDNFELLTEYERATVKIKVKHKVCNEIFDISPSYFLRDTRCTVCEKNKLGNKKTTETFKAEVKEVFGDEFTVVSEYEGSDKPIVVAHKCGTKKTVIPSIFLAKKYSCAKCRKKSK